MNLHEYQGKNILKSFGVSIQEGKVAHSVSEAMDAAKELTNETGTEWFVVKAQIHAGGRGKGKVIETGRNGTNTTLTVNSFKTNQPLSKSLFIFDESKYEDYYIDKND